MGIDINDLKILVIVGLICGAILIGKPHIDIDQHYKNDTEDEKINSDNVDMSTSIMRPYLTSQLNGITLRKDKEMGKTGILNKEKIDCTGELHTNNGSCSGESTILEEMTEMSSNNVKKKQTLTSLASRSDTEDEDEDEDDDDQHEERNNMVEWTEDDQRNLMDLGSSEIERNKRLESMIAKRRAKKLLSMQPRRKHNIDYLGDYYPCYDRHMDQVGTIAVGRAIENGEHQPGSAPSVLLPTRNPFDLPYEPHEEKPILTGGSFDEEFFSPSQKDIPSNQGGGELKDDPIANSLPSFFFKPRPNEKPRYSRFKRESEESFKDILEQLAREENDQNQHQHQQVSYQEVSPSEKISGSHDEVAISSLEKEPPQRIESDCFTQDIDHLISTIASSSERKQKELLENKENEDGKLFNMKHSTSFVRDQVNISQDYMPKTKEHEAGEDSFSSSSCETSNINASKNEAFRNSVKKVLTCLVKPKNKGLIGMERVGPSSANLIYESSPVSTLPTKMEERSFYTSRPRHSQTYSIASDMQVEVSEASSPTSCAALDASSPTDRESLVYDGDEERDANSGDEDLWGASPHPIALGNMSSKFRLLDIIEEVNHRNTGYGNLHDVNAGAPSVSHIELEQESQQAPEERTRTPSSLSPTSILPDINRQDVVDNGSTNGDLLSPRSYVSSSSEGKASQLQGKAEHLVDLLANFSRSETGSNVVEEPGPSHAREVSAEEISIQDESNPIFEIDEDKEDLMGENDYKQPNENNEQTSNNTSHLKAPNNSTSISNEYVQGDFYKEHGESTVNISNECDRPKRLEDEFNFSKEPWTQANMSFRDQLVHDKEINFDSSSTTCQEDIVDQSQLDDELQNGEVGYPKNPTNPVGSNSLEKNYNEVNHIVDDIPKLKGKDEPQSATIKEGNMEVSSSSEVVSSIPKLNNGLLSHQDDSHY